MREAGLQSTHVAKDAAELDSAPVQHGRIRGIDPAHLELTSMSSSAAKIDLYTSGLGIHDR
jgi:hypothetical protein